MESTQKLSNHACMQSNQGESSLESEGYAYDGNEESPSAENTENAKPNGELLTKGHNES